MPTDQLVAIDINSDRLSLAQKLGVPEICNSTATDHAELVERLKSREFDVVVDTSGSQAGLYLSTDIVKWGGLIISLAGSKGSQQLLTPPSGI